MKTTLSTEKMVGIGIFSALAFVVSLFVRFPVQFLTFDAKDAIMAIGSMMFGPLAGVAMSLTVASLELTISDTGIYGFIMNVASSMVFTVVSALIYRRLRTMKGAVLGLCAAVLSVTAVMMALNLLVTPYYMGCSVGDVVALIPALLLPFNLTKATLNAGLVLVLYKPLAVALRKAKVRTGNLTSATLQPAEQKVEAKPVEKFRLDRTTVTVFVSGLLIVALCLAIFLGFLNGSFS
jgi:riboflavin transporter FmnP